jgi:glycosyltransferase involved in cell wall biosynthesis
MEVLVVKILFLSELFYPYGGGAELATYLYAKLLSRAGVSVVVVTNRFDGEPDFSNSEGFAVYRLPLFRKIENVKYSILKRLDVLLSGFMRKLLRWADVVYVPRFWFSAIPLAKALGKPVITHLHDYIPTCPLAVRYDVLKGDVCERQNCYFNCIVAYEKRKRDLTKVFGSVFLDTTVWRCLREFIGLSDFIICVSKAQRDMLVKYLPSLEDKVRVIYNPLPLLSPVEMNGDDFGYFGGPSHLKGFHVLCRALSLLGDPSVVVHAANFSRIDEKMSGLLRRLGILPYRRLRHSEMDALYEKIRAVLVPSVVMETFSYVIVEAILRGRLIIASRIGGIPELVEECKGAFLFPPGNSFKLAEEIEHVAGLSRDVVIDLVHSNREKFRDRFDNEKSIKDFIELYDDLIPS